MEEAEQIAQIIGFTGIQPRPEIIHVFEREIEGKPYYVYELAFGNGTRLEEKDHKRALSLLQQRIAQNHTLLPLGLRMQKMQLTRVHGQTHEMYTNSTEVLVVPDLRHIDKVGPDRGTCLIAAFFGFLTLTVFYILTIFLQ